MQEIIFLKVRNKEKEMEVWQTQEGIRGFRRAKPYKTSFKPRVMRFKDRENWNIKTQAKQGGMN